MPVVIPAGSKASATGQQHHVHCETEGGGAPYFCFISPLSHGYLTVISRLSHGYLTVIARLSHGYLTVISRLSHGYLTVISRLSHGYLSFISRLSCGYPAAILRLSCGYPVYFPIFFVGQKQTTTKMPLSCGAGPVARASLPPPAAPTATGRYFGFVIFHLPVSSNSSTNAAS